MNFKVRDRAATQTEILNEAAHILTFRCKQGDEQRMLEAMLKLNDGVYNLRQFGEACLQIHVRNNGVKK